MGGRIYISQGSDGGGIIGFAPSAWRRFAGLTAARMGTGRCGFFGRLAKFGVNA